MILHTEKPTNKLQWMIWYLRLFKEMAPNGLTQCCKSFLRQGTNNVPTQASTGNNQLVCNNTIRIGAYNSGKSSGTATTRLKPPIQATEGYTVVITLKLASGLTFVVKELGLCSSSSREESLQQGKVAVDIRPKSTNLDVMKLRR